MYLSLADVTSKTWFGGVLMTDAVTQLTPDSLMIYGNGGMLRMGPRLMFTFFSLDLLIRGSAHNRSTFNHGGGHDWLTD